MKKIVLLCGDGTSSYIVYNCLSKNVPIEKVIVERSGSKKAFLKKRIKKMGLWKVLGQMAFVGLIVPLLRRSAKGRKQEILEQYGTSDDSKALYDAQPIFVDSVNDKACIAALQQLQPDLVVVNGTRIISEEVLNCIDATFINMHAGITPKYRGSHGAYWALYNKDKAHAGVTVHLVDKGIDTGAVLYQSVIDITPKDNFTTYPILQTCVGVEDELRAHAYGSLLV